MAEEPEDTAGRLIRRDIPYKDSPTPKLAAKRSANFQIQFRFSSDSVQIQFRFSSDSVQT
ncbi:hypothetical protein ACN38_g10161, partial [Penicillium nordicum]